MYHIFGQMQYHIFLSAVSILMRADETCIGDQSFQTAVVAVVHKVARLVHEVETVIHIDVLNTDGEMLAQFGVEFALLFEDSHIVVDHPR